jgi:uncharacterized protein YybS (DUF2232 family)
MMRVSSELRDLAAASALSALLFAAGVLVPVLGQPAGFVSSAPLIWLAARRGWPAGLLGGLVGAALLLPALPPPVALIYALEHALPAWYLGSILRRGTSIFAGSSRAALVVTGLMICVALLLAGRGRDPVQLLEQQLREGLAEIAGAGGGSAPSPGGGTAPLSPDFEAVIALLRRVLPAVMLVGIFLECSLNSLLAARVLSRGDAAARPIDLTLLRLPEWLVWVLIPALALCWAPQPAVATVALNVTLPLLFGYLIQGLSITLHFAERARVSRFGRVMFASAFVFFRWLFVVPLLLGLLDFRFDFRSRWPIGPPRT